MKRLGLTLALLAGATAALAQGGTGLSPGPGAPFYTPPVLTYVVNNWYTPFLYITPAATGVAPGANKVQCVPGVVTQTVSMNLLGVKLTTTDAAGNIQLAVYNSGTWGRPSTLVASTASITTAVAAQINSAVTITRLPAGMYWFCANTDSATAAVVSAATGAMGPYQGMAGAALQGSLINTTTVAQGISNAQTLGTWPTFTSGTVWADVGTSSVALIGFRVSSVP